MSERECLPHTDRPYGNKEVELAPEMLAGGLDAFQAKLAASMAAWHADGTPAVWVKVPVAAAAAVPAVAAQGFVLHHVEGDVIMMQKWLPATESKIPPYATHKVGVGGFVVNDKGEVLVVQEKHGGRFQNQWKLPGGLSDLGEDIGETAAREVGADHTRCSLLHCPTLRCPTARQIDLIH